MEDLRIFRREQQQGLSPEEADRELERVMARIQRGLLPAEVPKNSLLYHSYVRDVWSDGKVAAFLICQRSSKQNLMIKATGTLPREPLQLMIIHSRKDFLGTSYGAINGGFYNAPLKNDLQEGDLLELFITTEAPLVLEYIITLECWR